LLNWLALYWPSSESLATCTPSDTVSVPPVLAAFSLKATVVLEPNAMSARSRTSEVPKPAILPPKDAEASSFKVPEPRK
jgi:hypothetical protein